MDGDHLRGAPGRDEEGVHGMRNIDPTGKRLYRRPLKLMPGAIQESDRNTNVHLASPRHDARREPVFPGAGKEAERAPFRRQKGRDGGRELVRIFTHACSMTKRRSIVDQGAHARMLAQPR